MLQLNEERCRARIKCEQDCSYVACARRYPVLKGIIALFGPLYEQVRVNVQFGLRSSTMERGIDVRPS